jgi:ABC-2 type transport system permease protein
VGRIPLSEAGFQLAVQAAWVVALALFTRLLWRRAARRVISQGG